MITAEEARNMSVPHFFTIDEIEKGIKMMAKLGHKCWRQTGQITILVEQQLKDAGFTVDYLNNTVGVSWG